MFSNQHKEASPESNPLADIRLQVSCSDLPGLNKALRELLNAAMNSELAEYWDKETRAEIGFYMMHIPETYEHLHNFITTQSEVQHG